MTEEEVQRVRDADRQALDDYFHVRPSPLAPAASNAEPVSRAARGWFGRLIDKVLGG
ncbi:MAG TPA: hypothetical protein VFE73_10800 [Reyranella sp.]|jgi:hypothetical protein|nr:hypothetical protein [Reyranella sp.]